MLNIDLSEKILHFKRPARTSRGEYTVHRMLLVHLGDGQRLSVGECAPLEDLSCDRGKYDDIENVRILCRKALEAFMEFPGRPADMPDSCRNEALSCVSSVLTDYPALLFAIESALAGLVRDPILYDTPFARSQCGIPINGLVWMGDYDQMLERLEEKLNSGWKCVKIKIGAIDWEDEIKLLRLVRSRFTPSQLQLRLDANGAFSPEEAAAKLEELSQYGIHSIEQPIRAGQWEDMARLCSSSIIPIALDEELIGVNGTQEKKDLLSAIRPQYIVLKPTLHGGMSGVRQWIDLASAQGSGSWITSALESNIGLKSIALLCASIYGVTKENSSTFFPQGLGTGQLYTDNIENGISVRDGAVWIDEA